MLASFFLSLWFFRLVEAFEAYILCDVYVYHHACGVIFPFRSIRILSFLLLHSGLELFFCFAKALRTCGRGWHVGVMITVMFLMLMGVVVLVS